MQQPQFKYDNAMGCYVFIELKYLDHIENYISCACKSIGTVRGMACIYQEEVQREIRKNQQQNLGSF